MVVYLLYLVDMSNIYLHLCSDRVNLRNKLHIGLRRGWTMMKGLKNIIGLVLKKCEDYINTISKEKQEIINPLTEIINKAKLRLYSATEVKPK